MLFGARQRQHGRAHHMDEGDETRDRISRKSDERRAADNSHRHGTAGLDRHAPQHQRADAFDSGLDVVLFAGRNAAGGQDQVVGTGHLLQTLRQRSAVVPENAEVADLAAKPAQHRHQHEAVRIEQLRIGRAARPAIPVRCRSRTPRPGCASSHRHGSGRTPPPARHPAAAAAGLSRARKNRRECLRPRDAHWRRVSGPPGERPCRLDRCARPPA